MFDAIARRYDALNHLLSAGLDRRWRRRAVTALALTGRERLLDMCTGTADLAIAAATAACPARYVVGVDFSAEMLAIGHRKVAAAGLQSRVQLVRGDATRMPVPANAFECATVGFGIRNVADPLEACREFHRALLPGGKLAVLEFGTPTAPGLSHAYRWYFRQVLPRVGRLVSRHDAAYSYLPASVSDFPSGHGFVEILRQAGFSRVTFDRLAFGIVYLYLAEKNRD
jgi:demethylmenaquinone methyltransferase/2-methoxy-6-polyprenyl-1,4-benzoquinol methylase